MRQEWLVGGFFVVGCAVGGAMTWHVLRYQPNPVALDEESQSKLVALPFRAAVPTYLPLGSEGPTIQLEADALGAVRALLAYRTPSGCFGLLESAHDLPVVAGADAGVLENRFLGSGAVLAQPEVASTVLGKGATVRVELVGPSHLGSVGCPQPISFPEAKAILESLCLVAGPPPPLPSLR